jgi:hypothetical protein
MSDGMGFRVNGAVTILDGQLYNLERYGFDPSWWGVLFRVELELSMYAQVQFSRGLQAGVRLSHDSKRLAHGTKGRFHRSSLNRRSGGSQRSHSVAMSEDLEEGRGVIDVLEPWVLVNGVAKVRPRCPGGVGPTGLSSRDCIFFCVLDSQELGLEAKCSGRVANVQGC